MEAETLQIANQNISSAAFYGTFSFVPVVDGTFILERPTVTLTNGQVNGVSVHLLLHALQSDVPEANPARRHQPE